MVPANCRSWAEREPANNGYGWSSARRSRSLGADSSHGSLLCESWQMPALTIAILFSSKSFHRFAFIHGPTSACFFARICSPAAFRAPRGRRVPINYVAFGSADLTFASRSLSGAAPARGTGRPQPVNSQSGRRSIGRPCAICM